MGVNVVSKVEVPELVAKRQSQILHAAIELFGKNGYHASTIREVARRARMSVGLIYQYVHDKEDVLYLALNEVLDSYQRDIPLALVGHSDPVDRFCTAVRAYGHVIDARIDATMLVYRETKWLRRERREVIKNKELATNRLISDCIDACVDARLFAAVDVELLTYQIVMFCHAWALKAWHFRRRMSVDQYVDRGLRLMLEPLVTAEGALRWQALSEKLAARSKPTRGRALEAAKPAAARKRRASRAR